MTEFVSLTTYTSIHGQGPGKRMGSESVCRSRYGVGGVHHMEARAQSHEIENNNIGVDDECKQIRGAEEL